jgi:hypothetical protein
LTELTRRQLRELERSGQPAADASAGENLSSSFADATTMTAERPSELGYQSPSREAPAMTDPSHQGANSTSLMPDADRPLTRRELRLRAEAEAQAEGPNTSQVSTIGRAAALAKSIPVEDMAPEVTGPSPVELAAEQSQAAKPARRFELPPVGSRRAQREAVPEQKTGQSTDFMEAVDVEIPEDGLRGANYLGEPSTQSIVLDVAPEAISLATDTGEVFTTGSIAILPDTTGSTTGALDGIDLDSEEAVTGVISVVDPISAKDLIDERSPLGVVPSNVLRRGWWRPWVVGALSIAMAIAAILASITIFNALGD